MAVIAKDTASKHTGDSETEIPLCVLARWWLPEMLRVNLGVRAALIPPWASGQAAVLPILCSLVFLAQLLSQDSFPTGNCVLSFREEHQHILPRSCSSPFNKMPL